MKLRRAPLTPYPAAPVRLFAPAAVLAALLLAVLTALAPPAAGAQDQAVRGGDTLYSSTGAACPVAFNASRGADRYAVMQAPCVKDAGPVWYADPGRTIEIGRSDAGFPGGDSAVIRYTNPDYTYPSELSSGFGQPIPITHAAQPTVGAQVCAVSPSAGLHCGVVVAVNISISYPDGTVYHVFQTNVCAEPGGGGVSAYSGRAALGVLVSGNGNCTTGGTTFYQPVVEVLQEYGLSIP
ncbi:S1 family peptidase [Streptomyces sp. MAR4 CNX-425]|uniref:S1 family peptidase n=1 Tax=Streptomyces sp. MAR4 CNX-425 TaxID=3406343 RepID=UPI003B511355